MRTPTLLLAASLLGAVPSISSLAHAQAAGFSVDRFEPSERGSDWFALESLDLRGHLRPAVGVVGDFAYQPLAIYNADGTVRTSLVEYQLFAHVGGSLILWDRLRIGVNLPVAVYQTGSGGTLNGVTYGAPGSFAIGDGRIGADVRLLGKYGDAITVAGGVQVFVPIGSRSDYTGDENLRITPRLLAAGEIGMFEYAARVGVQYRGLSDSYAGTSLGSEMTFGAAAGLRTSDRKLIIGPELYGSTTLSDAFTKHSTPLEAILGAHYQIASDWRVGAGGGAGLTRGYGSPITRVVAVIEWAPGIKEKPPVVTDRDGDGIPDTEDACPDTPGIRTNDPKTNGCPKKEEAPPPPPPDRDGDGIPDAQDACPDVKGVKTDDPKTNGCPPPPPDRDGDGIIDAEDACPDVKGIKTSDPKTNGCPPDPDRDKDGIPNDEDACPDEPGPKNADPKKNGCPAAVVKNDQIIILEQVKFATGSAVILPASNTILEAVKKILDDHQDIKKVSIEGHTDNVGGPGPNLLLSRARAASVVTWLVKHGIAKDRLSSAGYGQEKPIDDNKTPEGRQNNRRVEFHIVDQSK
jgi:outer membrane protein OmpA-like peptidoglycan-associated protein